MFIPRNHLRRELLSICHHQSHLLYSTSANPPLINESSSSIRTQFINYLIKTLNFSKESAISSSSKVRRLATTQKCDSVIHLFKTHGFDDSQIKHIVNSAPRVLLYKPDKTLAPKIRAFLRIGMSTSDLTRLTKRNPALFDLGLNSRIIPTIDYLRVLVGSDEKVIEIINRSRWLFSTSVSLKLYSTNVMLLQSYGFSNEQIRKFLHRNAMHFAQPGPWITRKAIWVEGKLGISRDSSEFFRCFNAIASNRISTMERKMEVYKSFGFTDTELSMLFKNQPHCFALAEETIHDKLSFFMNEIGYTSSYLATCPSLFSLSLEKRVKPRNKVLKILKERMLLGGVSLITLVNYPELKFQDYLRGFEDEIPSLYETYVSSVR